MLEFIAENALMIASLAACAAGLLAFGSAIRAFRIMSEQGVDETEKNAKRKMAQEPLPRLRTTWYLESADANVRFATSIPSLFPGDEGEFRSGTEISDKSNLRWVPAASKDLRKKLILPPASSAKVKVRTHQMGPGKHLLTQRQVLKRNKQEN